MVVASSSSSPPSWTAVVLLLLKVVATTMWVLPVLLPVLPVVYVDAWGQMGHEIVGNLAWTLLSPATRIAVSAILRNDTNHDCHEYCSPLAVVADWADRVRNYEPWSAPLHYIDVQDDTIDGGCPVVVDINATKDINNNQQKCQFVYARDCVDDLCVAGAILNYTKSLLLANNKGGREGDGPLVQATIHHLMRTGDSSQAAAAAVEEALKFLVHFVGDIHQVRFIISLLAGWSIGRSVTSSCSHTHSFPSFLFPPLPFPHHSQL
jgi:hypothetical protein